MTADLTDQNILISGAGRGLGRSLALHVSSCGAVVGVADIDGPSAEETAELVRKAGGTAYAFQADLSGQKAFADVAAGFAKAAGRIDAVVNNAAVIKYQPIEQVEEALVDVMLGAGFKSALWGAQALLAHMDPERGGSIINFTSPVAFKGIPTTAVYTSVKGAILALTRTLAAELGPRGVRVNAVAPGSVPTPGAIAIVDKAEYERRARTIPLRRLGAESDNDYAVAFLLSKEASFINGAVLHVDGGIVAAG